MKTALIVTIILIGLFDYGLLVMGSHMEDREHYEYERWKKRQKKERRDE